MKSRLLLAVLGCASLAAPVFAWNNLTLGNNVGMGGVEACQASTIRRLHRDGYGNVRFRSGNAIGLTDGGQHVWGEARAHGWYIADRFSYSCSVDPKGYVTHVGVALH